MVVLDLEQLNDDALEVLFSKNSNDSDGYVSAFANGLERALRDSAAAHRRAALEVVFALINEIQIWFDGGCVDRRPHAHQVVVAQVSDSLGRLLSDESAEVRVEAVDVICAFAGLAEWKRYLPFSLDWLSGTDADLRRMVEDSDDAVASAGLRGLAAIGAPAERLGRAMVTRSEPSVRAAALGLLAQTDALRVDELIASVGDPDVTVKRVAIDALQALGHRIGTWNDRLGSGLHERVTSDVGLAGAVRKPLLEALLRVLGGPDPELRRRALETARVLDAEALAGPIASLLADPILAVRSAAATALRELGTSSEALAVAKSLEDNALLTDAALTLERFATEACVPQMLAALGTQLPPGPRGALIRAVCRAGGAEAVPMIRELARKESDVRLRATLLFGQARCQLPEFVEAARHALASGDVYLQRSALGAIQLYGDPKFARDIRELIKNPYTCDQAALALVCLQPENLAEASVLSAVLAPLLRRTVQAADVGYGFTPLVAALDDIGTKRLPIPHDVQAKIVKAIDVALEIVASIDCLTSYATRHRADVRRFMTTAQVCRRAWA